MFNYLKYNIILYIIFKIKFLKIKIKKFFYNYY